MTSIGLLGAGNIARILAQHQNGFRISGVFDRHKDRRDRIAAGTGAISHSTFEEFLAGDYNFVVEVASISAVRQHAAQILGVGKDLIILSVGGLVDKPFKEKLVWMAQDRGCKIRIPSGALFGLDNMKIGRISPLDQLTLRTTKPPHSLQLTVTERTCLFKGNMSECIRQFPKNANVAVALGLASGHEVAVELWVDPAVEHNTHEIFASGEFGEMKTLIRNVPSPDNPATSYLAALSIVTLLNELQQPLIVGT